MSCLAQQVFVQEQDYISEKQKMWFLKERLTV
ncbi:hypothetical protein SAMN05660880_00310 [Luteibacter sp. 22Crub2.1]|nr:hypothetical protein SAMN05660880_00310 [Luteibacter sp. 22Crub2.1]